MIVTPQHNVTFNHQFLDKIFPCPVCNMGLRLKLSRKEKPYCTCLECGIQIFFRGQEGIIRLAKLIEAEEAVAAEFSGHSRALHLYNRLQGLKRQKKCLEKKQWPIFEDPDLGKAIEAVDAEIERVREELEKKKDDRVESQQGQKRQ